MPDLVGREREKALLAQIRSSRDPELLAVYGRRRVGKTFLISRFFGHEDTYFELTGVQGAKLADQLANFADECNRRLSGRSPAAVPSSWREAFRTLVKALEEKPTRGKTVLFFDELPWLASRRSGFLQAFEYFWNSWASKQRDLIVVICGSAASWMLRKIIYAKGGLHNRVTRRIRLMPFTLTETEEYFRKRNVRLDRHQILELYMAIGGIPHYLRQVRPARSAAQSIDELCFSKDGFLSDEFERLYASLYEKHEAYVRVVETLARRRSGYTRTDLLRAAHLPSGGSSSQILSALEESGFIERYIPFGKQVKEAVHRLTDEYSLFYLAWIRKARPATSRHRRDGYWLQLRRSPLWHSWAGYAFEEICWKHIDRIRQGLGISGIRTEESVWQCQGNEQGPGAQIDLLIDRSDGCLTICEMKCSQSPFTITKAYATDLRRKVQVFRERTGTKKTIFLVMVTTLGTGHNAYYDELISEELTLDALF